MEISPSAMNWKELDEKPDSPLVMDINPTDYCNLKCRSCWQRNRKYSRLDSKHYELSDERLISLIEEAAGLGVRKVLITGGGEPLMRPVTRKLMGLIKSSGMEGEITTNGTLFTEGLLRELVEIGWDKIVLSIDGPDAQINDYLRGKGSFDKAVANILLLKKMKEETGKDKPRVHFNTVVSKPNHDKLLGMVLLAEKLGAKFINFEPLTVHSLKGWMIKAGKREISRTGKDVENVAKRAKEKGIQTNILVLSRPEYISKSNRMDEIISEKREAGNVATSCYEPWYHLVVKVDGSVGPCCIFEEKSLNVKSASLKEVWNSEWFSSLRRRMSKGELPEWCRICNTSQVTQNDEMRKILESKGKGRKGEDA